MLTVRLLKSRRAHCALNPLNPLNQVLAKKRGREALVRSDAEADRSDRKRLRATKKTARRKERRADVAEAKLAARINPGVGNPYEVITLLLNCFLF